MISVHKKLTHQYMPTCSSGRLVRRLSLTTPFVDGTPGKGWVAGLKRRHPDLVSRKPEATATHRMSIANDKVDSYFAILESSLDELSLTTTPMQIWNMDETNFRLEHSPQSVYAKKGAKAVPARTSNSRESITVLVCVNAGGGTIPPQIIVKGKTHRSLRSWNIQDVPAGTSWKFQQNAYMTDVLGVEWFRDVFLPNCGESRPQLLILDGHKSHSSLSLLTAAKEADIHLLALPPHTTHFLQPLDKGIFKSLKTHYNSECSKFLATSSQNQITHHTWPHLFNTAYQQYITQHIIQSSFKCTGIYPLNRAMMVHTTSTQSVSSQYPANATINEPTPASMPPQPKQADTVIQPVIDLSPAQADAEAPSYPNQAGLTDDYCPTLLRPTSGVCSDEHYCYIDMVDEHGITSRMKVYMEPLPNQDIEYIEYAEETMQAVAALEQIYNQPTEIHQQTEAIVQDELEDIFNFTRNILPESNNSKTAVLLTDERHINIKKVEVAEKQKRLDDKAVKKRAREEKQKKTQDLRNRKATETNMKKEESMLQKLCSVCGKPNKGKKKVIICSFCKEAMHVDCIPHYVDKTATVMSGAPFFCHKHMPAYYMQQ
jgi:hypothetical protein